MNKPGILVLTIIAIMFGTFLPIYSVDSEKEGKCIEGNCQDGIGKYDYANGLMYEGSWANGLPNGYGKVIIKGKESEQTIEGNFSEGKTQGDALFIINVNGKKYIYKGEMKDFVPHGEGTRTFPSGEIYSGSWVDGQRDGVGKLNYADGKIYTGEFKNGKKSGHGTLEFSKNEKYEGDFLNDLFDGQGTYYYSDGSKYVGSWKNDKEEGEGILYDSDGNISQQGKWVKGLFANPLNMIIKDAEEISADEYYIYNLDVWSYFGLWNIYDTELKRITYKKSKEYQKQFQELQDMKKAMSGQWYYSFLEKPFNKEYDIEGYTRDYDIKRNGFHIFQYPPYGQSTGDIDLKPVNNGDDEEENNYEENPPGVVFTPIPLSEAPYLGFDKKYHRGSLFLPMSQSQGLKIENNREKCNIYFMFKISKSDTSEKLLYASPVRVIVAHEDSGEVYYDKTFTSEK